MANLISKGDRWSLQFRIRPNQERPTIALGAMSEVEAKRFQERVEILVEALRADSPPDRSTTKWVNDLPDDLHSKLAKAGLVISRDQGEEAATVPTLAKFVDDYIRRRGDVKGSTATFYGHTRRCLVEFFGATRPIDRITAGECEDWRRWLASDQKLAENTIRRRCGMAKQFFRVAVRKNLISENPLGDMKGCAVRENRARDYFISRKDASAVLEACPDSQWRLLFALSRFGGLRCPSEHLALRWCDVDWERSRMTVTCPKTEHHEGKASRVVPIFPELRPYLEAVWEQAEPGTFWVITRYREATCNLRTHLERIIEKAGLTAWPKLWQNLRSTRETELAENFPIKVVCAWIGNSPAVAMKHYLQVTEEHFDRATKGGNALQMALQQSGDLQRSTMQQKKETPENAEVCRGLHLTAPPIVGDTGLEPVTPSLSSWCSNQLS